MGADLGLSIDLLRALGALVDDGHAATDNQERDAANDAKREREKARHETRGLHRRARAEKLPFLDLLRLSGSRRRHTWPRSEIAQRAGCVGAHEVLDGRGRRVHAGLFRPCVGRCPRRGPLSFRELTREPARVAESLEVARNPILLCRWGAHAATAYPVVNNPPTTFSCLRRVHLNTTPRSRPPTPETSPTSTDLRERANATRWEGSRDLPQGAAVFSDGSYAANTMTTQKTVLRLRRRLTAPRGIPTASTLPGGGVLRLQLIAVPSHMRRGLRSQVQIQPTGAHAT